MESESGQVSSWLQAFGAALARNDIRAAANFFGYDCYWRDLLAFTWTIKTFEGADEITAMLAATLNSTQPSGWALAGKPTLNDGVTEAWLTFETNVGRGIAHLRLHRGRCWTLLTTLQELKGFEELEGRTRPAGVEQGGIRERKSWLDRREQEEAELGVTRQPYCVIIGGGQGGIALAARLKRLGVPTLVIEKNERAGDSWRKRYRSLVLHDPVWYDHLPYLPFPDHWPVFSPKDQMGDWLEMYAKVMELNALYWRALRRGSGRMGGEPQLRRRPDQALPEAAGARHRDVGLSVHAGPARRRCVRGPAVPLQPVRRRLELRREELRGPGIKQLGARHRRRPVGAGRRERDHDPALEQRRLHFRRADGARLGQALLAGGARGGHHHRDRRPDRRLDALQAAPRADEAGLRDHPHG